MYSVNIPKQVPVYELLDADSHANSYLFVPV